jgi:two-component system CheB/CheR fusion protein
MQSPAPAAPPASAAIREDAPQGVGCAIGAVDAFRDFGGWIVAIGASAGGLDALERLFGALPCDTGAAFVVIQHLSPDHKSMMDNLLARYTRMPVQVAVHDQALAPDTVFLIPPGKTMRLAGSRLQLDPKPPHGLSLPIDIFFTSLAEEARDRAIGVVLSGTGSDGSRGVVVLNAQGGFVFAQDPDSAKFDGMPRAAIATGLVDQVAGPAELAAAITAHIGAPRVSTLPQAESPAAGGTPLDRILERLHVASGIDFGDYKVATVMRRIERRMQVLRASSLDEYERRLAGAPEEASLLRRELLIPVTRLFRDPDAYEALARHVIDRLVGEHAGAEPIRAWIAGCATGEEAYTVALLFADAFRRHGRRLPLKIFATDVEPQYLESAAAGWYPANAAAEVPAALLDTGFVKTDTGFQVRPEIRQTVIFARHNLLADPPFTRMHLVCCRNVLIYFEAAAQERVLERLRYALLPGGTLMLGPSESLGALHRDFSVIDARHKLYRLAHRGRPSPGLAAALLPVRAAPRAGETRLHEAAERPADAVLQRLAQAYVPPTLLIGAQRELLHVFGPAQRWLQIREGESTLDVLKLLPAELSWAAALLLQTLRQSPGEHRSPVLRVSADGAEHVVQLVARAVGAAGTEADGGEALLTALTFETPPSEGRALDEAQVALGIDQQQRLQALEQELSRTYDSLRATIEELETANEELQATNEELMASNEELQSTNEELQSVNEELYTVNSEYQEKVDILNSLNADLENVSKASAIPTLFVDDALTLVRFTPEAAQLFKVRDGDVGRSIEDFAHTLDYPELFADARRTIDAGRTTEREVRSRDGRWWLARMQPYADKAHSRPRAVMTFVDITSVKDFQRLQAIVDSLADHLAVVDGHGQITMVNASWRRFADANGDARMLHCGPGVNYLKVCAEAALRDEDARRAYDGLVAVLGGQQPAFSLRYPCHSPTQRRWFQMLVSPVGHPGGGAVITHRDITPWVEAPAESTP